MTLVRFLRERCPTQQRTLHSACIRTKHSFQASVPLFHLRNGLKGQADSVGAERDDQMVVVFPSTRELAHRKAGQLTSGYLALVLGQPVVLLFAVV